MTDVPRRLPATSEERLRVLADHTAGGSDRGNTRFGKRVSATRPQGQVSSPFTRAAGGVPLATGGGEVEIDTIFSDQDQVYVAPNGNAALFATKLAGDEFPRWVLVCDAQGGLYMGDGTMSLSDMINVYVSTAQQLVLGASNGVQVGGPLFVNQIVMQSPDGTFWDVAVANGGTVAVTPH